MSLLMVGTAILRIMAELENKGPSFFESLIGAIYVMSQMVNTGKLIEFAIRRNELMKIFNIIESVDKYFVNIGVDISYKYLHVLLIVTIVSFPICLFVLVSPGWILFNEINTTGVWSRSSQKCIFELMNLSIIYSILFTTLYFYNCIAFIMFQRLKFLNNYIILKEKTQTYDYNSISDILTVASEIHYMITVIARKFDRAFGWGIFCTITLSFMIVVVSIVIRGEISQFHPIQTYALNTILMVSSLFVVIVCQKCKFEANKVRCSVCLLTLPNFDKELSNKRCILLYQLLQEPIELQAAGFYPLDVTVITSHIGILTTLLMFFLKLRDVLDS